MPCNTKSASGAGSIRKITRTYKGKKYSYWEARFSYGFDPATGKQKQRSISGKTQTEVRKKLQQALHEIDEGIYTEPTKMTVEEWMGIWQKEYLGAVKPGTAYSYGATIRTHINPVLGKLELTKLQPHIVQSFYNGLIDPKTTNPPLSAKTVKNVNGVLHRAMEQAVRNGLIPRNPTSSCVLPRIEKKEIVPLDDAQIKAFLQEIKSHRLEYLFTVVLFTGMREGEALGLTWDCVDLERGTLTVNKQLQLMKGEKGVYRLISTKNGKARTITLAPFVVDIFRKQKIAQAEAKLRMGALWHDTDFVFTDEVGNHLKPRGVVKQFKTVMGKLGLPATRFHDLRHSYAVASIKSGDDIKTVQSNLGHATASFTLDVYCHVTNQMKQASADRMQKFIEAVSQ